MLHKAAVFFQVLPYIISLSLSLLYAHACTHTQKNTFFYSASALTCNDNENFQTYQDKANWILLLSLSNPI